MAINCITPGFTFQNGGQCTAAGLNNLVLLSVVTPALISQQTEITTLAADDFLLVYDASANGFAKISKANSITAAVNQTGFTNLIALNNSGTPNTKIDVTCSECVLVRSNGDVFLAQGISDTLDIALYSGASTPNGRDFATLTGADRFCGIWAISNGGLTKLLFSTANTPDGSPVLPAGYTYQCLLGVVFLNTGGTLIRFVQRNRDVSIPPASAAGTAAPTLNPYIGASEFTGIQINATTKTFSPVLLGRCIPSIAVKAKVMLGSTSTATDFGYAVATVGVGAIDSSPTGTIGMQLGRAKADGSSTLFGFGAAVEFDLVVSASTTIYAAVNNTTSNHSMRCNGYTLNL